jgi:hypothetical protein
MADLAGTILDAQVEAAADDEAAADARPADDAEDIAGFAGRADASLGKRECVPVVDETYACAERLLERGRDRAAHPVAVEVRQEDAAAVAVKESWKRDSNRVDLARLACERGQPIEDRLGAILGSRRLGTAVDDPLALEDDELDVRPAEIDAEAPLAAPPLRTWGLCPRVRLK